jgi:hypothetical protein
VPSFTAAATNSADGAVDCAKVRAPGNNAAAAIPLNTPRRLNPLVIGFSQIVESTLARARPACQSAENSEASQNFLFLQKKKQKNFIT